MMRKIIIGLMIMIMLPLGSALVSETIAGSKRIVVTLINQEPDPVSPGDVVDVRFRIENRGSEPAEDMEIRLVPDFPFGLYSSEDAIMIGTLAGGQDDELGVREKFRLSVDPGAFPGDNEVEFWYRVKEGPWVKAGEYDIDVGSRDPILAINKVETRPERIDPGSSTFVTFTLENFAGNTVNDIRLLLDVYQKLTTTSSITFNELPFTPLGSGNEKTVSFIRPQESKKIEFELFTDADAESKVYKVPYILTYTDDDGTNFSREGVVGLIVDAAPDLSVTLDDTEIVSKGQKGIVSIKFVNKGFSDLKFLTVVLKNTQNYDILSNTEDYIGNLDSDDFETADFELLVHDNAGQDLMLPLSVEYRDANGKLFSEDIMLDVRLYEGKDLKKRTGKGGSLGIGIIIVLVIVVIGIIVYRRRKRKKSL